MADINLGVGGANSAVAGGYDIDNSLKLEADNSEYLYYTSTTQTDYERMAFSLWIKRTELGLGTLAEFGNGTSNTSNLRIGFDSSDRLFCYGNSIIFRQTNQVFRDTSAWYHLFFLFDTTTPGGISNNRIRIWVNGEMIPHTEFGVINNPSAGAAMGFNNGLQQSIGAQREDGPKNYFNGYMAQVYGSGGTPPVVTDFGEVDENSGIWKPIDISELTPPDTQGFNLDFNDASNLGNDISTRNNNFTLQNITSADQATDTPTNNFCTWNPLFSFGGNEAVINEGATTADSVSGGWKGAVGTIAATNGKWYWEYKPVAGVFGHRAVGIMGADYDTDDIDDPRDYCPNLFLRDGLSPYIYQHLISGVETGYKAMTSWSSNNSDVFAIALNLDDEEITFYRNGTAITENGTSNTTFSISSVIGQSEPIVPYYRSFDSTEIYFNFGGYTEMTIASGNTDANGYGTFEYAPPSGYYALCTKNLAEYG